MILLHVVFLVGLISTLTLILGLLFLALPLLAGLAAVVRLLPLRLITVLIRVLFILTKIILPILLVDWLHIYWVRPFSLLTTLLLIIVVDGVDELVEMLLHLLGSSLLAALGARARVAPLVLSFITV